MASSQHFLHCIRHFIKHTAHTFVGVLEDIKDFHVPRELPLKTKLRFLFGTYEKETSDYMRKNIQGGIAIDVGAHVGYYSRLLSTRAEQVYAFEPDPDNYALLVKNTKRYPNITPVQLALSDTIGTASFFKVPDSTFRHSLLSEVGSVETTVDVTTLDSFMQGHEGVVSFVKIDVEGLEEKVLAGMKGIRERDRPIIIAEMPLNEKYTAISGAIGRHGVVRNYLVV